MGMWMSWTKLSVIVAAVLYLPCAARAGLECWPQNMTCFSSLPPEAMPWPTVDRDSYQTNDVEVMDMDDLTVSRVLKHPRNMCNYKEQLVTAMQCVSDRIAAKCPFLPDELLAKAKRFELALDNFCKEVENLNVPCMEAHFKATMDCHDAVIGPRPSGPPPTSSSSSSSPYPRPKPMMDRKIWTRMICQIKYKMMTCVKQKMVPCHEKTAQVMAQFMKDMASADCAAMMQSWTEAETGSAPTRPVIAWTTLLVSAIFLLMHPFFIL